MEIPLEYINAGKPWPKSEDEQLIKEYNIDKLKLLELSKIHKRLPGGITSRLVRLNIINMRNMVRGYSEYIKSDLYKEICSAKSERRVEKKSNIHKQQLITTTFTPSKNNVSDDIMQLKKDVREIKENVSKILELMNAVYEFENITQD